MTSLGACPGFYSISLATCVSGSTPFPAHIHPTPPHLHPLEYQPWYPGLFGTFWASPPGHRRSHPGALWRGSPGEPVGVTCLLPTPQECTVLSGPPGFLRRESARPSMRLVPCGDTFCLPVKGAEVGGSCLLSRLRSPRTPRQRPGCPDRREATPAFPPSLPPHHSSCLGPCWNVTGAMARACPNSRNTRFSPLGLPRPPALLRWMAVGRLFMPRRPPEVITASAGPCGGCCPHAAAPLITGGGRTPKSWRGTD